MDAEKTLTNGFIRSRGENSAVHSITYASALLNFSEARCLESRVATLLHATYNIIRDMYNSRVAPTVPRIYHCTSKVM